MLPHNDLQGRLAVVLEHFEKHFGSERILVDSSKSLAELELLRRIPHVDVKVIHLMRDVRSWATSLWERDRRDRQAQHGPLSYLRGQVRTVTRGPMVRFLQWYRENRQIERYVNQHDLPAMRIGYEELVFYSKSAMLKLCQFIGIEESEAMYRPEGSQSHVAYGNPMRHQAEKLQSISYDNRWLLHSHWLFPSAMLHWPVMRYNRDMVYTNVRYPATR
jgi:hypothetical protein